MRKLEMIPEAIQTCLSRREALGALAGVAGVTLAACSSTTNEPTVESDAGADAGDGGATEDATPQTCAGTNHGALTNYPQGTWKLQSQIIIGHDAKGLFAFSAVCTHQGCIVDPPTSNGATLCECHGSRFDGNGAVTAGPASQPLPHFALAVCNGAVYVDSSTTVAASTRTPAS